MVKSTIIECLCPTRVLVTFDPANMAVSQLVPIHSAKRLRSKFHLKIELVVVDGKKDRCIKTLDYCQPFVEFQQPM